MLEADYLPSRYNLVFRENGGNFIFNTRTSSFLRLRTPVETDFKWPDVPEQLKKPLIDGGFAIPHGFDEISLLKMQNRIACCDATSLILTVLLTMNCNMRCVYCYEGNNHQNMSNGVADKIIRFIEDRVRAGTRSVNITYYGGEPLLQYKLLCDMSRKIKAICKKNQARYRPSFVSNGTLLTLEKARKLRSLGFENVQITLDGPEKIHDSRRPFANGKGTFRRILKNIKEIAPVLNVAIRCNIDVSNLKEVRGLIDLLADRGINKCASLYFAPVHEVGKGCKDREIDCHSIFSLKEFASIENELMDYATGKGFRVGNIPLPKYCSCTASKVDGFVIEPNGNIQKCWDVVGCDEEKIGTIFDGVNFSENTFKWLNYDPFNDRNCLKCKILPLCMGWCPYRLMRDKTPKACNVLKHNIINVLKRFYRNRVIATKPRKGGESYGNWKNNGAEGVRGAV